MAPSSLLSILQSLLLLQGVLAVEIQEPVNAIGDGPVSLANDSQLLTVLFCCREDEELKKIEGSPSEGRCAPAEGASNQLLIYSQSTENFVPVPEAWRLRHGARPTCAAGGALRFVETNQFAVPFVLRDDTANLQLDLDGPQIRPGEYCMGGEYSVLACLPVKNESRQAAATMRPKLRKCCGENAAYEKNACVGIDTEATMSLEDDRALLLASSEQQNGSSSGNLTTGMEIVGGFPVCPRTNNFTILGDLREAQLLANASLLVKGQLVPTEEFCIERIQRDGHQLPNAKVFACSNHASKGSGPATQDIRFTLYPVGFIISAIFLAATLATGFLLPASHHVLHWRCQTFHVLCLMLGDSCMAVIQLSGDQLSAEWCRALAIMAHFFFLATFFWLNTMCFNIWWTFRDLRPASLEKGQELVRLRFYAAYAWGGPLIVAGIAAFLDHLPLTADQTFLRPRFGEKQCWFYGDMEILAYFYGPIGILLAINLIFFAATARELTCGLWKGEFVKSTTERAALGKVCLKLVVVMGVPWVFDVISWVSGGPAFLWYVTDLCNAAQGVLIFIVVGCQPQVRATLKRFWSRNPHANANRQGNGLSTTSHGIPSMGDSTNNPSTKTAPLETIC